MSSRISIVIPSTGHLNNLKKLIPSVLNQECAAEVQVIVVFNGVQELKVGAIKEFFSKNWPSVEYLFMEKKGVNIARNAGLEKATGSLVGFLDDDCELQHKHTLKKYYDLHAAHPEFFAIGGGYILAESHGLFDEVYNYIQMNWFVCGQKNAKGPVIETHYLLGGNFCLKRGLTLQHQLKFEPGIQYGGSELDFFRKATKAGLKLGAADIDVTHNTNEGFLSVGKKVFKQGRGKYFIDARFGNNDVVSLTTGGRYLLLRQIFSYWFWTGYYGAAGKGWKILIHIIKDIVGYLDVLRFSIIKKLSR